MKAILLSLALVAPAFAATTETYEVDSQQCMYTATRATCIVTNRLQWDVKCEVSVLARTVGKQRAITTRKMVIPAKRFETLEVASTEDAPIRSVAVNGTCTVVQ